MAAVRRPVSLFCFAGALAIAACTGADAPLRPSQTDARPSLLGTIDGLLGGTLDTVLTVFAIDPRVTATYVIGKTHRLTVQEGGICDLGSSYGIGLWDEVCKIAPFPVLVTARSWTDAKGHPFVEFTPSLRFAPLGGNRAAAMLYIKDKSASLDPGAKILYCALLKGCVDESLTDPSMVTMRDGNQGLIYRRIKHFSGYQVAAGRDGDPPADSSASQQ